jgi:hypothetical protein
MRLIEGSTIMHEQTSEPADPVLPKPKPKPTRRKHGAAPVAKAPSPPAADEFAGLSAASCAIACGPTCIISGDICVHPTRSGGLQSPHMMRPAVMAAFDKARNQLERQALDARHGRGREQPGGMTNDD